MIYYYFGDRNCKLNWNDFICLIKNDDTKIYKSFFIDFSSLYEYIDKEKNYISNILSDGYEYILENGVLHNLYGAAYIKYNDKNDFHGAGTKSKYFYINGNLVCDQLDNRGCNTTEKFKNKEIFFYKEITNNKTKQDPYTGLWYRRREGIDYTKTYINLDHRIKIDQRKKKLKKINDYI